MEDLMKHKDSQVDEVLSDLDRIRVQLLGHGNFALVIEAAMRIIRRQRDHIRACMAKEAAKKAEEGE